MFLPWFVIWGVTSSSRIPLYTAGWGKKLRVYCFLILFALAVYKSQRRARFTHSPITPSMTFFAIAAGLLIAIASIIISRSAAAKKRARRLPPGPPGRLFLGNAHQIPRESSWLYYAELKKKYGASLMI